MACYEPKRANGKVAWHWELELTRRCITWDEPHINSPPIGANKRPIMKRVGKTVLGVRMGCHAFSRCCLNAVSV